MRTSISRPTRVHVSYAFETVVVTEKFSMRCHNPLNVGLEGVYTKVFPDKSRTIRLKRFYQDFPPETSPPRRAPYHSTNQPYVEVLSRTRQSAFKRFILERVLAMARVCALSTAPTLGKKTYKCANKLGHAAMWAHEVARRSLVV